MYTLPLGQHDSFSRSPSDMREQLQGGSYRILKSMNISCTNYSPNQAPTQTKEMITQMRSH